MWDCNFIQLPPNLPGLARGKFEHLEILFHCFMSGVDIIWYPQLSCLHVDARPWANLVYRVTVITLVLWYYGDLVDKIQPLNFRKMETRNAMFQVSARTEYEQAISKIHFFRSRMICFFVLCGYKEIKLNCKRKGINSFF